MTDTSSFRAVFDTNVIVAALLSRNSNSPLKELLSRWRRREFELLYCLDLLAEYREKLISKQVEPALALNFLRELAANGVRVELSPSDVEARIPCDPDDDIVAACALVGGATHLVTYDPHFQIFDGIIGNVQILDGLRFLYVVRGDRAPD